LTNSKLEAAEDALATSLAARVEAILKPYLEREGADGFPAIVAAEAEDVRAETKGAKRGWSASARRAATPQLKVV
jgi:hypothetical protein